MTMPVLFELAQDRATCVQAVASRALADWFSNGRGAISDARDLADVCRDVEDLIVEATTFSDLMRRLCRSIGLQIQARLVDDYGTQGEALRQTFQAMTAALEKLDDLARSLEEATGRPTVGWDDLKIAVADVRRLHDDTLRPWPWPPTQEDIQRESKEIRRGEALELNDAFAEIAGVSVEEWQRRVKERRIASRVATGDA